MNDPGMHKAYKTVYEYVMKKYKGESTLFIIDDCSASKELKDMLSYFILRSAYSA